MYLLITSTKYLNDNKNKWLFVTKTTFVSLSRCQRFGWWLIYWWNHIFRFVNRKFTHLCCPLKTNLSNKIVRQTHYIIAKPSLYFALMMTRELGLCRSSHPAVVHYNTSLYSEEENLTHESEIGPQVVHIYSIRNKGPSDIQEAEVHFLWPTSTLARKFQNLLLSFEDWWKKIII